MYLFYEIGEKKIAFGHSYDENCCCCPVSAVSWLGNTWWFRDEREYVHNPTALLFWARILPDPQKWELWLFLPCFVTNANDCHAVCFCFSSVTHVYTILQEQDPSGLTWRVRRELCKQSWSPGRCFECLASSESWVLERQSPGGDTSWVLWEIFSLKSRFFWS